MKERKQGSRQTVAAAKAGLSERSARRIDHGQLTPGPQPKRPWRTRPDPLIDVWDSVLVPLLEGHPALLPSTLYEVLCDHYPGRYDQTILRTLQRRVKDWKVRFGPAKEVIFRQSKEPGRLGFSDFTRLKGVTISIAGQPLDHLLYHYRLAYSGWCYVKVTLGGESYTALSTGLQNALWRSGGVPAEHRTDSLSAAYKNRSEQEALTERYEDLCRHYGLKSTRNNLGVSHENGVIESAHGHLKRRIEQALLLRQSADFPSLEAYQQFIDGIVHTLNQRCRERFQEEGLHLQPLPKRRTHDYAEHRIIVSRSSTFELKRVTYTVPSRFVGERLYVQLYDHELKLFHGHQWVLDLPRIYAPPKQRRRCVNYRHVIDALVRKPQAFRYSQLRDDLLPSDDYRRIWTYVDAHLPPHQACRYLVRLLHLAAKQTCERPLGRYVIAAIERGELPNELECQRRFAAEAKVIPIIPSRQHPLADYDQLIGLAECRHG
jgi:transposase InsO family protein